MCVRMCVLFVCVYKNNSEMILDVRRDCRGRVGV